MRQNILFVKVAPILAATFFLFFQHISAQNASIIKGVVKDEKSKNPIAYANISTQNSTNGTNTNSEGRFEIEIIYEKNTSITVSHINYYKKQIEITDKLLTGNIEIFLTPKDVNLSDVVVSAGLYEQKINRLTKSAKIIKHEEITAQMNSNITDMLASTPGFTQVWEYHSPIILRGLNSNRIIIMKDGNRRIGTFPGGYFGQDMNIYDTRKIEIIKGPGSVVYGSGAISGILNFISNEPFGKNTNKAKFLSGYGSNNNEFLEIAKICHKKKNFGISLNGKYRKTDCMIYGDGKTAENSEVEDHDFSLNTGYKFSDKHKIILNANYHYGDWGKPRGFNGPTKKFTQIRNEEENIHTNFRYIYSPNKFVELIQLNLFYDNGKRDYFQYKYSTVSGKLSSLNLVHYKDNYGGGRLFSVLNLSQNDKLTIGIDAYLFKLDNPSDIIDYYNNTRGKNEGTKDAGQENSGVFFNNELKINTKWQLITGIRYDKAKVNEGENINRKNRNENRDAFSGNMGVVYSPNPHTHFSANFGRAFRMPTAEELFTQVLSCKGVKVGNSALKPEFSQNIDLGIRGLTLNNKLKYDITLFYNKLDDFTNEAPAPDKEDIDFTYQNTDAKIMGGELSALFRFADILKPANNLYAGLGASYIYGVDLSGNEKEPLFGIPPFKIRADLKYHGILNKKLLTGYNLKIETEYAASQSRIPAVPEGTEGGPWGYVESEPHTVFNFYAGINSNKLKMYPKIRFVIKNVLNTAYQPYGSYIPAMGRNFKIVLMFEI